MRPQIQTKGIVLSRTDYQEADRIVTMLTPDHGKIRLIAKGVRRSRSKLAPGIELFSISHISYVPGRGDISTLVSTRLEKHFGTIVQDIHRTMFGYEVLKRLNRITESAADSEYFDLVAGCLKGLDAADVPLPLIELWFCIRLLNMSGHQPDFFTDIQGIRLKEHSSYTFNYEQMAFVLDPEGLYQSNHIRLFRTANVAADPLQLSRVHGIESYIGECVQLARSITGSVVPNYA